MIRLTAAALFFGTVWLAAVGAQAESGVLGDDSHIQLRHIMVAVQAKPGSFLTQMRPMTPIMTVPKGDDVAFVCQRAPRATEAVLYYFQKNPAPLLPNRHVDIDAVNANHARIAAYVNRALGRNVVSEVYMIEGAGEKMATGAATRLPFAHIQGCSRLMKEYEERMKKLLDEKE